MHAPLRQAAALLPSLATRSSPALRFHYSLTTIVAHPLTISNDTRNDPAATKTTRPGSAPSSRTFLTALCLVPLAVASPASPATLHVPASYSTIQAAITAAQDNDTILVAPGTYTENITTQSKWLVLYGEAGASQTVIDGGRRGSVITLDNGGIVQGFTLQNGQSQAGGAIWAGGVAQTIVRENIIRSNTAGYFVDSGIGGGIYLHVTNSSISVSNNSIANNYAGDSGGGIYDNSSALGNQIRANTIIANGCHVCGGGLFLGAAVLNGNVIANNWADSFGGGVCGSGAGIVNNTIVGNFTNNGFLSAAGIWGQDGLGIYNNIVVHNHGPAGARSGIGIYCEAHITHPRIACNDSWGNDGMDYELFGACDSTAGQNRSVDPLFCGEPEGDYALSALSPCAPGNSGPCGIIGALPVDGGCTIVPTTRSTWGALKLKYR